MIKFTKTIEQVEGGRYFFNNVHGIMDSYYTGVEAIKQKIYVWLLRKADYMNRIINILFKKIDPGHYKELWEAIYVRQGKTDAHLLATPTTKAVTKDRIGLFISTCAIPFSIFLNSTRQPQEQEYCFIGFKPQHIGNTEECKNLLEEIIGKKLYTVQYKGIKNRHEKKASCPLMHNFTAFLKWYFLYIFIAALLLFNRQNELYYMVLFVFFHDSLRILTNKDLKELYGYGHSPCTYLTLLFAHNIVKIKPNYVVDEFPLHHYSWKIHFPAKLLFTLPIQAEEYYYYKKLGFIVSDSFEMCNLTKAEYAKYINLEKEPCDIGYFCSGLWAIYDSKNITLPSDEEQLSLFYKNLSTPEKQFEEKLYSTIINYAEANDFRLHIYLRPGSRKKLEKYEFGYPYDELIKENNTYSVIDAYPLKTSHAYLKQPRLAITFLSSTIFRRMALGNFQNLYLDYSKFNFRLIGSFPPRECFGKYANMLYEDEKDLIKRMDEFFIDGKPIVFQ